MAETTPSEVPPYDGRNTGRNERAEGPERMLRGDPPPSEPTGQPGEGTRPRPDADTPPEGVGESTTRRGEDVRGQDGKEAGRHDGPPKGATRRPTGTSDARDVTGTAPG
jgi:hypothetical protein